MFSNEVLAVHLKRANVKHDKFNYIGFTILELAKQFMYRFVYDYLESAFGENVEQGRKTSCYKLHYTDTDSIFLELMIPCNSSLDNEIEKIKDIIHPSDLCKVKAELGESDYIREGIFLGSKCYCFQTLKQIEKKLKGISRATLKHDISIDDYKNSLFNDIEKYVNNYRLKSDKHNIQLIKQNKLALTNFDDKRVILNDGIETIPYGYSRSNSFADSRSDSFADSRSDSFADKLL